MWDVLQSSYADVEHELRVMSGMEPPPPAAPGPFRSFKIIFVAGDGLALMRLNHLLANKSEIYIDQSPVIIPIQGARAFSLYNNFDHGLRVPARAAQTSICDMLVWTREYTCHGDLPTT